MIWLYRLLIFPVLWLGFHILALLDTKIRQGLLLRWRHIWRKLSRDSIWIHCSSGEFEYAKPLIPLLKNKFPDLEIVITYFSPTYATQIEAFPGVDACGPLPWDSPFSFSFFIKTIRPRCLLVARTDLWPEMLEQAQKHKIPAILFSSTLSEHSRKNRSLLARLVSRWLFNRLSLIATVTEEDAAAYKTLTHTPVHSFGDTRFDQVLARLKSPRPVRLELKPTQPPTIVCGSTWPQDETVLLEAIQKTPQWVWVIAPHEPSADHLRDLEQQLQRLGLSFRRYSEATQAPAQGEILLIDQVGILAELYQWGDVAFVGGSFRGSVHSVMEPLAAGCRTLVGPDYQNNREAILFHKIKQTTSKKNGPTDPDFATAVMVIQNAESMVRYLDSILEVLADEPNQSMRTFISNEVQKRTGASRKLVDSLENFI